MTPSLPNSAHGELAGVVRLELRPPYLAPLSRGSRCRLRSLHGIRADTCAVADDAGFPSFLPVLVLPDTVQVIPHVAARTRAYR